MTVATVTATAPDQPVATTSEPTFQRGRHLALSVVGLAHAPLSGATGPALVSVLNATEWTAEISTLNRFVQLCFVAFVAWLAFVVFDTHSGVTILPKRWREFGLTLAIWCVGIEVYSALAVWRFPAEHLPAVQGHIAAFTEHGDIRLGWLSAAMLAAALAEEIVYRVLLLRALEGYMQPLAALLVQAAVFELVHAFVYGYGLSGAWFIAGAILGWAFQRTRSLAIPTLLHATHNIVFFTLVWHFNQ